MSGLPFFAIVFCRLMTKLCLQGMEKTWFSFPPWGSRMICWGGMASGWACTRHEFRLLWMITMINKAAEYLMCCCFLTLLLWATLAVFSRVNLSTLLCLSWNMREPRLDGRLSSSTITSCGMLIFFPKFRPSGTKWCINERDWLAIEFNIPHHVQNVSVENLICSMFIHRRSNAV